MSGTEEDDAGRLRARVGEMIRGKWRLDALLGAGGMAAVYAATHHVGHRVAIKILHPERAVSSELRARFEQEALAAARLGHPAAVQVLDIDVTEQGEPFLVMELLEGESLRERAYRLGGVPLPELLGHVDTLLEVLGAAHAAGIVHRDIKPDNLFVTREGRIKVLDFGVARMKQGGSGLKTRTGAVLGTTSFMAPEQILGREVDGRADLYAVGATMFTILTNRRVHEAATEGELLVKMGSTPAPPLASVAPGVDPRVARIVDRALAFQVERRYPDAPTMLADIRAVRAGGEPPFATAERAKEDERTRVHGRAIPDGPPVGAAGAAFAGAGGLGVTGAGAAFAGAGVQAATGAAFAGAGVQAATGAPGAAFAGAGVPAATGAPAAPWPGQAAPEQPAPGAAASRAPGSSRLVVVASVAVILFCVGIGAVLLLWPSGDASDAGAAVSLADIPQASSSAVAAAAAGTCQPGAACVCPGGVEGKPGERCALTCGDAPGCKPSCSRREVCETRCAGGCEASCARTKACDTRCTDGCSIDCRNADTCQATCGTQCSYTCEDVASCGPVVGEASVVRCNRVGECHVTCTGSCAVSCTEAGSCEVECQGQGPAKRCKDGRRACGQGCALPR
ncbi:serine/threonine-protein kinase [Sorangium sp. So ce131]|uniref:serine/threonine-protein kinase n=1 Tax=Sorangium sp. So ce131 TaxID=3133282 RepID=UPI003F631109